MGWFTAEVVRRMVAWHPEHEFYLFYDRHIPLEWVYPNLHQVVLCPPARHPILWYLFFEWSVPWALRRYHIDLFISTDGWMSLRTKVPTLTVIHDLNFEHANDYLRPSYQRYMKYFFPRYARRATRIATVSEFSRSDIIHTYGISPDKIDVVYSACNNHSSGAHAVDSLAVRQQYAKGSPYFLFVGTISKRKNLVNLLSAFDRFKQTDSKGIKFVIVGNRYWWGEELRTTYDQLVHRDDVLFLGRQDTVTTSQLLHASLALLFVSLFEGFGVPILEGFEADTVVITSDCSSMPEVAGDAALLVNPTDVNAIAQAMTRVADSEELRHSLIAKGRRQRQRFSWDDTARRLWQSVERICDSSC